MERHGTYHDYGHDKRHCTTRLYPGCRRQGTATCRIQKAATLHRLYLFPRHAGIELGIERTDYNHYHGEVAAQCRYLATVMYLGSIYSRHQSVLQPAHQPGTFFYLYVEHHQLEPAANSSCMCHIPIRVGMDAAYFRHYQYRLAVCMVPFCQEGDRIKTARYAERHLSLSLPIHCTRSVNSLCYSAHRKPILKYGSQNHYGSWALCTGFVETTIYHLPGKH